MKTRNLICGLMLMAGVACNEEEVTPGAGDGVIRFGVPGMEVETEARSGPLSELEEGTSFGVLGYCVPQTAPNDAILDMSRGGVAWDLKKTLCAPSLFYKQKVTYTGGACAYDPLKEWYDQTDFLYSFFAYYPYDDYFTVTTTENALGAPSVKFSIPVTSTDVDYSLPDVQDAMVAQEIDVQKGAGVVTLDFYHILTGLNFQVNNYNVTTDENGLEVPGKSVTIHSLKLKGTFYKSIVINFDKGYDYPDETYSGTYTIVPEGSDIEVEGLASVEKIGGKTLLLVSNLNKTGKDDGYLGQLKLEIKYTFGETTTTKIFGRPENFLPAGGTIYTAQLNFIGDSFVLNFIVDNDSKWEDGSDTDITFE